MVSDIISEWWAELSRNGWAASFRNHDSYLLLESAPLPSRLWPSGQIMPSGEHPCNRKIGAMSRVIRGCALLLMAFTAWTEPALARSYLNCLAKKVVIVDAPRGSTSSSVEEHLGFWIDEAAENPRACDGTPLTVHRFDDHWISAARGDTSYELERQNGNLAYASSTMKDGTATIIVGSGRCQIAAGPPG